VTDNGTTFTSELFGKFCKGRGIEHLRTAPYHPASNGQAERFVDTLKRALTKMKNEGTINETLHKFLQIYRSTPNPSSCLRISPAEAIFGRQIRTQMSLLLPPKPTSTRRNTEIEQQYNLKHGAKDRGFIVGNIVNVQQFDNGKMKWFRGKVIERFGSVLYNVMLRHKLVRVHANQIVAVPLQIEDFQESLKQQSNESEYDIQIHILLDDFNIPHGNQENDNSLEYISLSSGSSEDMPNDGYMNRRQRSMSLNELTQQRPQRLRQAPNRYQSTWSHKH
jgi:hypothetical protein